MPFADDAVAGANDGASKSLGWLIWNGAPARLGVSRASSRSTWGRNAGRRAGGSGRRRGKKRRSMGGSGGGAIGGQRRGGGAALIFLPPRGAKPPVTDPGLGSGDTP